MDDPRFSILFAHLSQPACVIDSQGQILAWNPSMVELTQQPLETALGQLLGDLGTLPEALAVYWSEVAQQEVTAEQQISLGDHIYQVTYIPLPPSDWLILLETRPLPTKADHRKDPWYNIVHDLKTPLTSIKGFADLVGNFGSVNDRQAHYLKRIMLVADEMTEMVNQLLDFAWVDSNIQPKLSPVNLAHLVHAVATSHAEQAKADDIDLQIQIDYIPLVLCDEQRIKQVINNLISNAIKYSPDGGIVQVSLRQTGDQVLFEVIDQGIGIPPEHLDKIFERFYRVPGQLSERIKGNGLGLAISYEILKKHGSTLYVESAVNQGSRFYFYLSVA
jgi:signal transduction histidine kinase